MAFDKAIDIAKYCVYKTNSLNKPISNLELQILLYVLQQNHSEKYHKPMFYDNIEIAGHFPRIENVYYHFAGYGAMPIEPCTSILKKYEKSPLSETCLCVINETIPQFINSSMTEKTDTYMHTDSIYNKTKKQKLKTIEPKFFAHK